MLFELFTICLTIDYRKKHHNSEGGIKNLECTTLHLQTSSLYYVDMVPCYTPDNIIPFLNIVWDSSL